MGCPAAATGGWPPGPLTCRGGIAKHSRVTSEERTKRSYERRPYPTTNIAGLVEKGGSLPPLKWMQAVGRPGRSAPQRVLVAGCGTGVEAFVMRRRLPTAEIVAVDFSPRSIVWAQRLERATDGVRPITFRVGDLTDRKIADVVGGDFDLITCHGVLSYLPKPSVVLENMASCLRAGGALYLGVNGEAHPATRLRPWLASFGLAVDELREERRLRELLGLWDALNDDGSGELATMSSSYLGGDVCGPHFNNWSLARWRAEANHSGWEVAGTDVLPMALHLAAERKNDRVLYPAGVGELAARLDQARPAGFHRIMLRRATAGALSVTRAGEGARPLQWTGLYSVRFSQSGARRTVKAIFNCAAFHVRFEHELTAGQQGALRALMAAGVAPDGWTKQWNRTSEGRRLLWLWAGLGVVAVGDAAGVGVRG